MKREKFQLRKVLLLLMMLLCSFDLLAQVTVTGTVTDEQGNTLPGVNVFEKGTSNGTITDLDGKFVLKVTQSDAVVTFSFIGYNVQELAASSNLNVVLKEDTQEIEEVVVVGYGQQKKASVVGAITQTTGKVLERSGGISNVGAALTGNLPGVVTAQGSGMPGEEEPQIQIRGVSSWNNSAPLVLVDGVEREMSSVDMSSVQSVSVLKDASATAVYGVKGANGVILITTKRGSEGSAKIDAGFATTLKTVSKLPGKMDSYDALMGRNQLVEHEIALDPTVWQYMKPQSFINMYRNQTTQEQRERYANVDWQDYLFKDVATSYNAYVNISGGTKFVKYYAAVDYVNEGDIYKIPETDRGYDPKFAYQRINVRSNLDFNLTKSTTLKVNLAGSNGIREVPWRHMHYQTAGENGQADTWQQTQLFTGVYSTPPDVYLPKYADGSWGYYAPNEQDAPNSADIFANHGAAQTSTTTINTDFILDQDLGMLVKGLSARAMVSMDNRFFENNRGVGASDLWAKPQKTYIYPEEGKIVHAEETNHPDKVASLGDVPSWTGSGGEIQNGNTTRRLYYQGQINFNREFGKHNVGAMGMFSRNQFTQAANYPFNREDWAFRVTYNWAGKYFAEYNGAYNGSEKFSSDNRFAFFNSGAIGWLISGEDFMKNLVDKHIIEILKLRLSLGQIGDDNVGERWLYMDEWNVGGNVLMSSESKQASKYQNYAQTRIGNPDIHWEKVTKSDIGIDYSFLGGLLAGSIDFFMDKRTDVLLNGNQRAVPDYFGATPASINKGEVQNRGYEFELRVEKTLLNNKLRLWGNFNMTHNENKIKFRDDIPNAPSYQKSEGYMIGQGRNHIDAGFIQNYDDIYGTPALNSMDERKLPGDRYIVDFNADGIVDEQDSAPFGRPSIPQNSYNATIGAEYKGFSFFAQFYGVNNVSRTITLKSYTSLMNNAYDNLSWWTPENTDADITAPRLLSTVSSMCDGTQYVFDGSYIRLKNVELAYTWTNGWIKKLGLSYLKLYANGNNLFLWSHTPDDREVNDNGQTAAYPVAKRYTFGVKFSF